MEDNNNLQPSTTKSQSEAQSDPQTQTNPQTQTSSETQTDPQAQSQVKIETVGPATIRPTPEDSTPVQPKPQTKVQPGQAHLTKAIILAALPVFLTLTMTVLDSNIVNVALPSMAQEFHTSRANVVWVINIYQLVITMLLLTFAAMGDLRGYKVVFTSGVMLFTIGSTACAFSVDLPMLLVSRAVEGIGAAGIMSVNIAMIRIIYPRNLLGSGLAINAMIVGGATALGPTLAGAILSIASWHWLFAINIPIGIVAWFASRKYLNQPNIANGMNQGKLDKISAVENAILFGLIIMVMEGFSHHRSHALEWIELAVIAIVGFFYIKRQFHLKLPLFPVDLLKLPRFTATMVSSMMNFVATMLAMVSLPFFLKEDLGYNVMSVGLLISPWPIVLIIASPIAGRLCSKMKPTLLATIGMGIAALGLMLLYHTSTDGGYFQIAWRIAVCGFGFGIYKTPNNVVLMRSIPLKRSGAAGGLKSTSRLFGQCIGTAMVAMIFRMASVATSTHMCLIFAAAAAVIAGLISIFTPKEKPLAPQWT